MSFSTFKLSLDIFYIYNQSTLILLSQLSSQTTQQQSYIALSNIYIIKFNRVSTKPIPIISVQRIYAKYPLSQHYKLQINMPISLGRIIIVFFIITTLVHCNSTSSVPSIYGVRWFMGEHFKYQLTPSEDSNEHLVLMFNSDVELKGQIYVFLQVMKFSCTYKYISTENISEIHHADQANNPNNTQYDPDNIVDAAYIYKCIVGDIRNLVSNHNLQSIPYEIKLGNLYILQDLTKNQYSYQSLFKASFRLPYYNVMQKIVVIGDWGIINEVGVKKGYVDVMPCLLSKVQEDMDISMAIFTGDLAYDLKGEKYYKMLKYIQVITSKMVFMVTPGNHDTLYHNDTFELFTYTFYSPQWKQYLNYYYTIQNNHLLFLSYDPEMEAYDFKKSDRIKKNISKDILQHELPLKAQQNIKDNFFTIVFSHYPVYCSDINDDIDACENNAQRFKLQRAFFNNISMNIYLSGHVHVYERSKPICYNGTVLDMNVSDMSCPIYIVQGVGGNNEYVQIKNQYPQKNYSAAIGYNTGFGIITLQSQNTYSAPNKVTYQHFSSLNCTAIDTFSMLKPLPAKTSLQRNEKSYLLKTVMEIGIISLGITMFICLGVYVSNKYKKNSFQLSRDLKNKKDQNAHVQMIQEHFQAPQSDKQKPMNEL